jgi:zinc transporter 1
MLGVLIHVVGDAANNVGVIISALVIWLTSSPSRYYADPTVSMAIALVILTTSLPLGLSSINLAPARILNDVLLSEELG